MGRECDECCDGLMTPGTRDFLECGTNSSTGLETPYVRRGERQQADAAHLSCSTAERDYGTKSCIRGNTHQNKTHTDCSPWVVVHEAQHTARGNEPPPFLDERINSTLQGQHK